MENKQIVIYVDGVFDIIHSGHFNAIRQAKKLGDNASNFIQKNSGSLNKTLELLENC